MKVLVVGARPGSLGAAVQETAIGTGWEVVTAGISSEDVRLDVRTADDQDMESLFLEHRPDHVVCTVGINRPRSAYFTELRWWADHFSLNVTGPMGLLSAYKKLGPNDCRMGHFVAISSNSAHIPRTQSGAYCASKAALSMALQVAGREAHGGDGDFIVYGYEPGLLASTPMTEEVRDRLGAGVPLTRMRGFAVENGISAYGLAGHIIRNIGFGGPELNGCLLRYDAGEI